ncbi:MAG TPA: nuclear transport factor 2 family protein [Gemmatimonadota bacterium]|nr:nuclear transport factor 2 family protein [Gemmatimonadota bacterium]
MQRLVIALALVFAMVACQPAAETPPETAAQASFTAQDEAAIRGMLEKFVVDVNAEDWTANISYYDADAVRMPPNEPMMQGHAAITEWLEARPPVTGFTLTPQVIAGDGDVAYARGAFTFDLAPPDADPVSMVGKWHAIYERQADGSWLCVSDIWNTDAPVM